VPPKSPEADKSYGYDGAYKPDVPGYGKDAMGRGKDRPSYGQDKPDYGNYSPDNKASSPAKPEPDYYKDAPEADGYGKDTPSYKKTEPGYGEGHTGYGKDDVYQKEPYGNGPKTPSGPYKPDKEQYKYPASGDYNYGQDAPQKPPAPLPYPHQKNKLSTEIPAPLNEPPKHVWGDLVKELEGKNPFSGGLINQPVKDPFNHVPIRDAPNKVGTGQEHAKQAVRQVTNFFRPVYKCQGQHDRGRLRHARYVQ